MNKEKYLLLLGSGLVLGFIGGVANYTFGDAWLNATGAIRPNESWSENVNVTGYLYEQNSRVCTPANNLCPMGNTTPPSLTNITEPLRIYNTTQEWNEDFSCYDNYTSEMNYYPEYGQQLELLRTLRRCSDGEEVTLRQVQLDVENAELSVNAYEPNNAASYNLFFSSDIEAQRIDLGSSINGVWSGWKQTPIGTQVSLQQDGTIIGQYQDSAEFLMNDNDVGFHVPEGEYWFTVSETGMFEIDDYNSGASILYVNTTGLYTSVPIYENDSRVCTASNGLCGAGSNASFNQTLTDALYYPTSNPAQYYNVTTMPLDAQGNTYINNATWYSYNPTTVAVAAQAVSQANYLQAHPWPISTGYTWDLLSIAITTANATTSCRWAVYNNTFNASIGKHYPGSLIYNSSIMKMNGTYTLNASAPNGIRFRDNSLYWGVTICNNTGGTLRLLGYANTAAPAILGQSGGLLGTTQNTVWRVSATFTDAWPTTFPAGATMTNYAAIGVFARARTDITGTILG